MVRVAKPKDISRILEMYEAGLTEAGETDIREDHLLKKVVNSYYLAPCFLLIINGKIKGMAGFTALTSSHNGVASMTDYMFFVEPESRSLENLSALITAAKHFAEDKNIPIKIESLTNNDESLRKRLFTMHGFTVYSVTGTYNR